MFGIGSDGLLIILVILLIYFVFREVNCWYWKQNEIVSLLKDIRYAVELQAGIETKENKPSTRGEKTNMKPCPACGNGNLPSNANCISCGQQLNP